jgi:hypothetical protein
MDYLTAAEYATVTVPTAALDDPILRIGFSLASHAWQHCAADGTAAADWDMFGVLVDGVAADLYVGAPPIIVAIDDARLTDSPEVRSVTVRLVEAAAARLDKAAGDASADTRQRWAWALAAARLRTGVEQLR